MKTLKELTIQALENLKGDDFYRAKTSFAGLTEKQMKKEYGRSGMTCAELLASYQNHEERVKAAIAWVRSLPEP